MGIHKHVYRRCVDTTGHLDFQLIVAGIRQGQLASRICGNAHLILQVLAFFSPDKAALTKPIRRQPRIDIQLKVVVLAEFRFCKIKLGNGVHFQMDFPTFLASLPIELEYINPRIFR